MMISHAVFWIGKRTSKHQDSIVGAMRPALLQHEVGYQLKMQPQYIWWVRAIAPLVMLIATSVCDSWQVVVVV